MAKRALAWFLVAAGLSACSAGSGGDEPSAAVEPSSTAPVDEVAPSERDVAPVARYQFVDTTEGMAVESVSDTQVTTFICPTRSCTGLCDECAAEACRLSGELAEACQFLRTSCLDSCVCNSPQGNCGFPVCSFDSMICYVGDDTAPQLSPSDPGDPNPFGPAGRPGQSSSNAARPDF
jgi:hypothetical protein